MISQNKTILFWLKRQAKNVFPKDCSQFNNSTQTDELARGRFLFNPMIQVLYYVVFPNT